MKTHIRVSHTVGKNRVTVEWCKHDLIGLYKSTLILFSIQQTPLPTIKGFIKIHLATKLILLLNK